MENPFNLTIAKLKSVKGKLNKNFPPIANNNAKAINPRKINFLNGFDIFLEDIFAINFNRK